MRESISLVSKLNELRLLLIHPQSKNKIYVLVEGTSDIKLFRKLFHGQKSEIKSIPGGISNLEKGLQELSENFDSIIGIRDADFLHIEGKKSGLPVLFLTDVHDMEMMLIASDETFKSILYEFSEDMIFEVENIRQNLLESIKFIGYLRWYNEINNLELNFKDIGITDFIDLKTLKLNEIKCIKNVLKRSPNKKITNENELLENTKSLIQESHDLSQICCGHDVTKYIALNFNSNKKVKGISHDRIESHLRTSYTIQHFRKTRLFSSIKEWCDKKQVEIFEN